MSFTPRGPRPSLDPHKPITQSGNYLTFILLGLVLGVGVGGGLGYLLRYFYFTGIFGAAIGMGLGVGASMGWRFAPRNPVTFLVLIVMGLVVFVAHHYVHYQFNHGDEAWAMGQVTKELDATSESGDNKETNVPDRHQQFEDFLASQVGQGGFSGYIRWRLEKPTAPIRPWASETYFQAKGTRIFVLVDLIALLIVALWLGPEHVRTE
ncbi:MAG: hypothetical protein V2A74_09090 [bacterium]